MCFTLSSPALGTGKTWYEEAVLCLSQKIREEANKHSTKKVLGKLLTEQNYPENFEFPSPKQWVFQRYECERLSEELIKERD